MLSTSSTAVRSLLGRHHARQPKNAVSGCRELFAGSRTRSTSSSTKYTYDELLAMRPSLRAKAKTRIEAEELLDSEKYGESRLSLYYPMKRALKKHRLLMLGPHATVTFESYDLMWLQAQEMIFVEGSNVSEELQAYNPLVPNGNNLIVTLMFEIENPIRRDQILRNLGHVEDTLSLKLAGKFKIAATSIDGHDIERTTSDGKTSAVHFLKFDFDEQAKAEFLRIATGNESLAELEFSHPNYPHSTKLPIQTLKEIANDLL